MGGSSAVSTPRIVLGSPIFYPTHEDASPRGPGGIWDMLGHWWKTFLERGEMMLRASCEAANVTWHQRHREWQNKRRKIKSRSWTDQLAGKKERMPFHCYIHKAYSEKEK